MHAPQSRPIDKPRRSARKVDRRPLPDARHITLPCHLAASASVVPGETIAAFLSRTGLAGAVPVGRRWSFRLPTILVMNGAPVPQRLWKRRRIRPGDALELWSRPWGGGGATGSGATGKAVLGIVALVALAAFAPWAAGIASGALFGGSALATSIISGGIIIGGGLLVAALTRPAAGGQSADPTSQVEQLYSVAAQGNTTRLLQPLTVQYGRLKSFPDFAIAPWSEFSGNDQFLNVLLATGMGRYSYENLFIDDTVLWTTGVGVSESFNNVTLAFYDPNASVTLFPTNVTQSSEVSGQDVVQVTTGPFAANAPGSHANAIAADLVFPNGCFRVDSNNELNDVTVTVVVEARQINDAGAPLTGFIYNSTQAFTFATRQPQRATIKYDVPVARYEVRISRTTAPEGGQIADAVVWVGLRAFIDGPSNFPVSTVAIRIKANSQLTGASARKFGVLCTRMLPVWNVGLGIFQTIATRNPFWAAYDAAVDSEYGIGRPPSKVDFQTVYDQALAADARGDHFDYRFNSGVPAPQALDTILRVTRARHRWSGDVLTFVRDEWSDVPRMLLTDREIARGSLAVDYVMNPDDASDAATVEYVDEDTWGPGEVQYPVNSIDFTAVAPARIQLDGIVNRDHAHREAAFYYLVSQMRRVNVALDTEHDGRMLGFGSRVRVQSELPDEWGASGVVVSLAGATLTVDRALDWSGSGTFYIAIRTKTGGQFGPVACSRGTGDTKVVLDGVDLAAVETAQGMTVADALARADGADDPSFDFGLGTARARDCIVMTGRPSQDRVTLGLVVDNEAVHSTDLTEVPTRPSVPALVDARTPIVEALYATFRQGVAEPILDASWVPAAGALYYVARVSYDSGASYTPVYEGITPSFYVVVDRAALRLQVAGVGRERHGPWTEVDLDAPVIRIGPDTVGVESLIAGLHDRIINGLKAVQDQSDDIARFIASVSAEADARAFLDAVHSKSRDGTLKTLIDDSVGDLDSIGARVTVAEEAIVTGDNAFSAFVSDVTANYATTAAVTAADATTLSTANAFATGAVATLSTSVTASLGTLTASVNTNSTAVADISGHLAASYAVTIDVNGYASGFKLLSNGVTSNIAFAADNFTIGSAGVSSIPVFQVGTVGGVASVVIKGSLMADGAIIARTIAAGAINTSTLIATNVIVTGNLQAGAATAFNFVVGVDVLQVASGPGLNTTLVSKTATVVTGNGVLILVNFGVEIASGNPLGPINFDIRVDGVSVAPRVFVEYPGSYTPAGTAISIWGQKQVTAIVGVNPGAGSHAFSLVLTGTSNGNTTIYSPTISIFESRR